MVSAPMAPTTALISSLVHARAVKSATTSARSPVPVNRAADAPAGVGVGQLQQAVAVLLDEGGHHPFGGGHDHHGHHRGARAPAAGPTQPGRCRSGAPPPRCPARPPCRATASPPRTDRPWWRAARHTAPRSGGRSSPPGTCTAHAPVQVAARRGRRSACGRRAAPCAVTLRRGPRRREPPIARAHHRHRPRLGPVHHDRGSYLPPEPWPQRAVRSG